MVILIPADVDTWIFDEVELVITRVLRARYVA